MFDLSPDCLKILELDGTLVAMNAGGCRVMEIDDFAATCANQPWVDFWPGDGRADALKAADAARAGSTGRFRGFCPTAKGTPKWWDVSVSPVPAMSGQPERLLVISRDVTDAVTREAAAIASRELAEAASHAKDRFLASLAHELRTPMSPVLITATSFEHDTSLPDHVRDAFTTIRRNVALQMGLIDDLWDVSAIRFGKLTLRREPVAIHGLLTTVVEMLKSEIDQKSIAVTLDLAAPANVVQGDSGRLSQVFWNLLRNAVKFSSENGRIAVRTRFDDGMFAVEIEDTGLGIEPDQLRKIFDAFDQGNEQTRQDFGGMGLGLAIAHGIIEHHRGRISAISAGRGTGATFTVQLPCCGDAASVPDAAPSAVEQVPLNILLVDDHEDTVRVMSRILKIRGHRTTAAYTAAEARTHADAGPFDVVISDLGLPDSSGLELMAYLRDRHPTIKGVALSGHGDEDYRIKSAAAGFTVHLTKPVGLIEIEEALRRVTVA